MGILSALRNVLFPESCRSCGKSCQTEELCASCIEQYHAEAEECCPRCGEQVMVCTCGTQFALHTGTRVGAYPCLALTFYKSRQNYGMSDRLTEKMLYSLKSHGTYARFFADELAEALVKLFAENGENPAEWSITYLPRSTEKMLSCGFDQSRETARLLAQKLRIPMVVLFARECGLEQKKLNRTERLANAEDSLVLIKKPEAGGKYLLLDDIITTGATMETAAKHLRFCGAGAVFPVVIARNMPKEQNPETIL